ncbi:hypothetical protein B0O99DRAFT_687194 [Bisporella sp. PMI_857]|nr:hypothetical protein B0O99DRAFT_687194 [Bisporella sp. PMI_857]
MSKLFCTLAWYHDAGTMKPQLIISANPTTNLVVKGSDWKGARFGNMNATTGSRDRFEYSFTGGKSVTRASLVMNTSAILPPILWLSRHPTGAPTKRGPRGDPKWKAAEEAKRVHEAKMKGIEYIPDDDPGKKLETRIKEKRTREKEEMNGENLQQMLEDNPYRRDPYPPRRRDSLYTMGNRSYDFTDEVVNAGRGAPDAETRRRQRQQRLRGSSANSSPVPLPGSRRQRASSCSPVPVPSQSYRESPLGYEYIGADDTIEGYGASPRWRDDYVDSDRRRQDRYNRLRSSSDPENRRYRRSHRESGKGDFRDDANNDGGDGGGE